MYGETPVEKTAMVRIIPTVVLVNFRQLVEAYQVDCDITYK